MQPQWRLETIFRALENIDRRAMPFRALLETFLHLEAPAGEHWVQSWSLEIGPRLYVDTYTYIYIYTYISLPQPRYIRHLFSELLRPPI